MELEDERVHEDGSDEAATVFIVDDDGALRESLAFLVNSVGYRVETFSSARAFLDGYDPSRAGCLVLDIRMPGMSGLELQERLAQRGSSIAIVVITGFGDVPMAVRALKHGAIDFLEKPFTDQDLLDRISEAIEIDAQRRATSKHKDDVATRMMRLTMRERQVMSNLLAGKSNKAIASQLGLSPKTVEVHRARMMHKMRAATFAELLQLVRGYES
jgi:FixJ family two-component response regulator